MNLLTVELRSERRVRLHFSSPPSAAAFTGTGTISVSATDGIGADPPVAARLVVPSAPAALELALGLDLAEGGHYGVSITSLPAADASTCTASAAFSVPSSTQPRRPELVVDDGGRLLYGIDLAHAAGDYVEDVDSDLATIEGVANAEAALRRRATSDPLSWDGSYGGRTRDSVDGPLPSIGALRGRLTAQLMADDRSREVRAVVEPPDEDHPDEAMLSAEVVLVGSHDADAADVQITVPLN